MSSIKRTISILVIALLLLSGCKEDASSSSVQSGVNSGENTGMVAQPEGPVVETNLVTGMPLNSGMTTGQRPVAIMINNAQIALPQRGISSADAIFEMVTEGGITRFMTLYADVNAIPQVGPVRSARDQHLQFAMPLNTIFVHIGSSVYAANLLNEYAYQDIDGMYLGTTAFWFDSERNKTKQNEHCWYTDAALITAGINKQQILTTGANVPLFNFLEVGSNVVPEEGQAPDIAFSFSPNGTVRLTYDAQTGTYFKQAYGQPQIDESNAQQLNFTNAMLLFTDITLKPDGQCTEFNLTSGTGYYCYGGMYREIKWEKGSVEQALKIMDLEGNVLAINPGKSYIAIIGNENKAGLMFNAAAGETSAPTEQAPVA